MGSSLHFSNPSRAESRYGEFEPSLVYPKVQLFESSLSLEQHFYLRCPKIVILLSFTYLFSIDLAIYGNFGHKKSHQIKKYYSNGRFYFLSRNTARLASLNGNLESFEYEKKGSSLRVFRVQARLKPITSSGVMNKSISWAFSSLVY